MPHKPILTNADIVYVQGQKVLARATGNRSLTSFKYLRFSVSAAVGTFAAARATAWLNWRRRPQTSSDTSPSGARELLLLGDKAA